MGPGGLGSPLTLPEVMVRGDKEDGNAVLPATAASARGDSLLMRATTLMILN